jgi:two-component sensor histidine kinase
LCEQRGGVAVLTTVGALLVDLPGTATSDMGACLHALCRDLAVCFARPDVPLLSCSTAAHHLPTGTVITLGLIADLLLTNAYTFGFVPPEGGRIAVSFSALETTFELTIEDSGLLRRATARRRGDAVTIASLLVGQLGGWIETPRVVAGSRCIIILPRHANRRSS